MHVGKHVFHLGLLGFLALVGLAAAQNQTFSYTIPAVDVIAASGAASIDLAAPVAGAVFAVGSSSDTTLSFTSNDTGLRNITAVLDTAMPAGTQLTLTASGGTRTVDNLGFTGGVVPVFAAGATLSTSESRLVTGSTTTGGFSQVAYSGVTLTYDLTASLEAAPQTTAASRTITFTVVAN